MAARFLIVGAGFSGAVLANRLLKNINCTIDICDERNHAGGNCHTKRDERTGIMVHRFGPHIFNTDRKDIWDYVNSFGEFKTYVHRVKAMSNGRIFPMPVNLFTINQFFNKTFSPEEAKAYLASIADQSITDPQNFEEQALSFIGKELYEAFFYGYTKKQWGCEPSALPASILKRIPVRFNYDDNYHNNVYTGIPVDGYSSIIEKMMDHPNITLSLNTKFTPETDTSAYTHVFYTGPIDAFFNYSYGRLGYRTVSFEKHYATGDFQGLSQMNYCDESVAHTRIVEHKHFTPWEKHDDTIYFKEYSTETKPGDVPYYPKRLQADKAMLQQYREHAATQQHVSFLGRLATYRYMDMQHVIIEALNFADECCSRLAAGTAFPTFANEESF